MRARSSKWYRSHAFFSVSSADFRCLSLTSSLFLAVFRVIFADFLFAKQAIGSQIVQNVGKALSDAGGTVLVSGLETEQRLVHFVLFISVSIETWRSSPFFLAF